MDSRYPPQEALRSLARQGRYLVIGFASGDIPAFPANIAGHHGEIRRPIAVVPTRGLFESHRFRWLDPYGLGGRRERRRELFANHVGLQVDRALILSGPVPGPFRPEAARGGCGSIWIPALVAQWIEHRPPEP